MAEGVFVHQFELGPWDNFMYLIGDRATRRCAVVDPAWDEQVILEEAQKLDVTITDVLCTHSHFDHVNRVDQLLKVVDAKVHMLRAEVDFADFKCENLQPASPGDVVKIGDHLEVTMLHTPGHTPGSASFRTADGLVTGDTLFVEGCGRCDFVGGDPEVMHRTLHDLVDRLPGATKVYPGHNYGSLPVSSLDHELEKNPYLKQPTLAAFVSHRMDGKTPGSSLPEPPPWPPAT